MIIFICISIVIMIFMGISYYSVVKKIVDEFFEKYKKRKDIDDFKNKKVENSNSNEERKVY